MAELTIKEEMLVVDTKRRTWWNELTDEQRKKIGIWVMMRYVSSCDNKLEDISHHYLIMTNELVNVHFNILRNHPQLQHQLMQVVGLGSKQLHPWIAPPKGKKRGKGLNTLRKMVLNLNPYLTDDEIDFMISSTPKDELETWLQQHGMSDKEIKAALK